MLRKLLYVGVPVTLVLLILAALTRDDKPKQPIGPTCRDSVVANVIATECVDAKGLRDGRFAIRDRQTHQVHQERTYRSGVPHGRWTMWKDGRAQLAAEFEAGRLITVDGHAVKRDFEVRAAERMVQLYIAEAKALGITDGRLL